MDGNTTSVETNPFSASYRAPLPTTAEATDVSRKRADRPSDITLPVYPSGNDQQDRHRFDVPHDLQRDFDAVCSAVPSNMAEHYGMEDAEFNIFKRGVLSSSTMLPPEHDIHHADLIWAWMRIVCAGAGYQRHAELSRMLCDRFPLCPMDEGQSYDAWHKDIVNAHAACGWPVTITSLDARAVAALYPSTVDRFAPQRWMRVLAMFHVAKYLRYCPHGDYPGLVYQYAGETGKFKLVEPTAPMPPALTARCTDAMRLPPSKTKAYHVITDAVRGALSDPPDQMPATQLPRALPVRYIVSPAAHPVTVPPPRQGFLRTGFDMAGVWEAANGKVTKVAASPCITLDIHWAKPAPEDTRAAKLFEAAVPRTYKTQGLPSRLLLEAFPNLEPETPDPDAWHCMLSAIILSGLMPDVHGFTHERPLVPCMPTGDRIEDTTNTGKTTLALALARTWSPAIDRAKRPGQGAPSQRSTAAAIERHGTAALDEFRITPDETSLFCETNLMAMATGGTPEIGKVYSNAESRLSLLAPLPMACKVLNGKDDIFNRAFPLRMRQFTDAERASPLFNEIASGKWSLGLRLSCYHMIETSGFTDLINSANPGGGAFRFNHLRLLAGLLMFQQQMAASLVDALDRIDQVSRERVALLEMALRRASETGMKAEAEGVGRSTMSAAALFDVLSTDGMDALAADLGKAARKAIDIFAGVQAARGWDSRSIASVYEEITGDRGLSRTRISRATNEALTHLMPQPGAVWQLPGSFGIIQGYHLRRVKDQGRQPHFKLIKKPVATPQIGDALASPHAEEITDDNATA